MSNQETGAFVRKPSAWLFAAAILAVGVFAACDHGTTNPDPDPVDPVLYTPMSVLLDTGEVIFENCTGCHNGGYGTPGSTPPLINSNFFMNNRHRTIQILLGGTSDSLYVNGMWYEGNMPSWPHLTNTEIAGVLTYIRSVLNDSTVVSCVDFNPADTSTFDENGYARCQKNPRPQAERDVDSVAVWEVKMVRDSIDALAVP